MPVSRALLDAIAEVESGNAPQAVGDQRKAVGAYQMQRSAYEDVQRVDPKFQRIPYERLHSDPTLQRQAAERYLEMGQTTYGITDPDRLISFYNAGPQARRGKLINPEYVAKVKRRLGNTTMRRFR